MALIIKKKVLRKLINVESDGASSFSKIINLPRSYLDLIASGSNTSVVLVAFEMFKGYHMLDDITVNTILVNGKVIEFDKKNYDTDGLVNELTTKLAAAGFKNFKMNYDESTDRFTIMNQEPFTIDFVSPLLAKYLGFEDELYASNKSLEDNMMHMLISCISPTLERYDSFTVCSSLCSNGDGEELAYIYVESNTNDNDVIKYVCNSDLTVVNAGDLISSNSFTFKLIDSSTNKEIALNRGSKWRMTIALKIEGN